LTGLLTTQPVGGPAMAQLTTQPVGGPAMAQLTTQPEGIPPQNFILSFGASSTAYM